ncbi:tetratricopeptide repeat protein [uncultured Roseibium sp.]|uniref:tetratricopeptide repeat protein n=1 Tax=uncultured Roseibium sp. TaxID=1936171 RepID=UPI003216ABFE
MPGLAFIHQPSSIALPRTSLLGFIAAAFLALLASAGPSLASDDKDALFDALKSAKTEAEARLIEDSIWWFWLDEAPDTETRHLVDEAMRKRDGYDFEGARLLLNDAIERAPDYAEVWNQRAFILFLQDKLDEALEDADRALELEPRHFGALSGKAHILMRQGRVDLGQQALRQAIEIYPFIKERHMLIEPKGDEL